MAKAKPNAEQQVVTPADVGQVPPSMLPSVPGTTLPSTPGQPPSILEAMGDQDELARAFMGEVKTRRSEVYSLPLAVIDHKNEIITVDNEPIEQLGGYPIHWFQTRAWWEKGFKAGAEEPPACWSLDMVTPSPSCTKKQSPSCTTCKHAQFGSNAQGGQACRTRTSIFLLNPAFGDPPLACLALPPSSIRAVLGSRFQPGYFARAKQVRSELTRKPVGYHELVWMKCLVKRAGELHCVLEPEPGGSVPSVAEAKAIAAVREKHMPAMENIRSETVAKPLEDPGEQKP